MTEVEERLVGLSVVDVMVTRPKTLPAEASVDRARRALHDDHVHMVLLVDDGVLVGTVVRSDLPDTGADASPAREVSRLQGRTVSPSASAVDAFEQMRQSGVRRLAVVGEDLRLLGLLCLKRRLHGFCSDDDVASRAAPRRGTHARRGPRCAASPPM